MERGKYIVIEGNDGTGKSTQVDLLQQYLTNEHSIDVIQVHEPDGFAGDARLGLPRVDQAIELRKKIKNQTIKRSAWQNVEWFTEARKLNWQQALDPALGRGIWVVAARNYLSTIAYQGYGEHVPIDMIVEHTRSEVGERYMRPDIELVLTLGNEAIRQSRIDDRGPLENPDTFESKGEVFQASVNQAYLSIARDRAIPTLDASRSVDEVQADIRRLIGLA